MIVDLIGTVGTVLTSLIAVIVKVTCVQRERKRVRKAKT